GCRVCRPVVRGGSSGPFRGSLHGPRPSVGGDGRGIARCSGQACNVSRLHVDVVHVLGARPDSFVSDVATAEALNKTTVSSENLLTVLGLVVADDDRLPAAKMKTGDGVFVRHAA